MKTNRSARMIVRIRSMAICLSIIGMVGVAFWLGESLAALLGQVSTLQVDSPQAQNINLGALIAAR